MKLVVGLGNPGKTYAKTRHNVGFMALDFFRESRRDLHLDKWDLSKKFNAEIVGGNISNERFILAKPMTFMNDSGIAVALIANFYKMAPKDIIVVHDDKDIAIGTVKVQKNRGAAGHNGVISIMQHLGTEDFTRIRIGIKSDEKNMADVPNFVLGKFGILERRKVNESFLKAKEEIEKFLLQASAPTA